MKPGICLLRWTFAHPLLAYVRAVARRGRRSRSRERGWGVRASLAFHNMKLVSFASIPFHLFGSKAVVPCSPSRFALAQLLFQHPPSIPLRTSFFFTTLPRVVGRRGPTPRSPLLLLPPGLGARCQPVNLPGSTWPPVQCRAAVPPLRCPATGRGWVFGLSISTASRAARDAVEIAPVTDKFEDKFEGWQV